MVIVNSAGATVLDADDVDAIGLTVQRWKTLERETLLAGFNDRPETDVLPKLREDYVSPDLPATAKARNNSRHDHGSSPDHS
jgi:hypothetical protein